MINVLMPIAGFAKRFTDIGITTPKPLITVAGQPMIKLAVQSLVKDSDPKQIRLIFVVRHDHCVNHDIANVLTQLFSEFEVKVTTVDHVTKGTLCSCLIARDLIPEDEPLVIYTPDVCFTSSFDLLKPYETDGVLLTFKANSPDHSYVTLNTDGHATETAEKVVISGDALVGVYCFAKGKDFLRYADEFIGAGVTVKGEFFVSPMFNLMIRDGLKIGINRTDKMYVLGTPDDLEFYESYVVRYNPITTIVLCCDHSGYALKNELLKILSKMKTETGSLNVIDFGAYTTNDSDHYDTLKPCAEYVLRNSHTIGIGICQTGQGFNISANKIKGIRAALIHNSYQAEMGRRHNAANFFCLPSNLVLPADLSDIITTILAHSFDGGRHATRIRKCANDPFFVA
jgi:RpiB/LacA/LacB family sugar-phosphate isomerase